MKIAVVGGSKYKDKNRVYFELSYIIKRYKVTEIISGDAPGTDTFAKEFAAEKKIPFKSFPAQWDDMSEPCYMKINTQGKKYNALAGFKRNTQIVNYCDKIVAFWNGSSAGTLDSISKAEKSGKEVLKFTVKY